ncbi:MAG: hypothetical protein ACM3WV_11290 [Bacillota bacterium]
MSPRAGKVILLYNSPSPTAQQIHAGPLNQFQEPAAGFPGYFPRENLGLTQLDPLVKMRLPLISRVIGGALRVLENPAGSFQASSCITRRIRRKPTHCRFVCTGVVFFK